MITRTACKTLVMTLAIAATLTGCQEKQAREYSGFLSDYSRMEPIPAFDNAVGYKSPDDVLRKYDKFIVEPVTVKLAPDAGRQPLEPDKVAEVTGFARDELTRRLSERYMVVDAPGPGVLRLKTAVTDIQERTHVGLDVKERLQGYWPGGAAIEMEAVDSQTGKQVIAAVVFRSPQQVSRSDIEDAKEAVRSWIDTLIRALNRAHDYGTN